MVEPIMLITTHEQQRGKDHSPYLLGNVDVFDLNMIKVLRFCLFVWYRKNTSFLKQLIRPVLYIIY